MTTNRFTRTLRAAALCAMTAGAAPAGELAIYNWADYFGPDTINNFEAETGIRVTLDHFDSNEMLETRMLTGRSDYDVVFPAASNAARQFRAGALSPIDPARLTNHGNLDPEVLFALNRVEGGAHLGVPYTWGTIGIAYNTALVAERLGDHPMDTLDVLFDPEIVGKLAECGIAVLDSPVEMLSVTLNYLGANPYSGEENDLARARDLLSAAAPHIRYFSNQRATGDLAAGNICVALIYSGDAGIAQARASETGNMVEIAYAIPREGTLMWIDLMAIPHDAKNTEAAYRFIDYILRPKVIAEVTNTVYFANANRAAAAHVATDILSDPGIYPDAETRARLFPDLDVDARMLRQCTRAWTAVKSGQ